MNDMDHTAIGDSLHRLVKLAMDTGEAETLEEAQKLFMGYRLAVSVGKDVGHSKTLQAALLTIVNSARRSLLGGIEVEGIGGMNLLVPIPPYRSLEEAVAGLGGRVVPSLEQCAPLVAVGNAKPTIWSPFAIRVTFEGWSGGILPLDRDDMRLDESQEFTPAGALAGALAVTEAFQFLRGNHLIAGRRAVGLSIWRPELSWRDNSASGPAIDRLPSALWLIGLGNLGQAYLWTLGMLPYAAPDEVQVVLQDHDFLADSNNSTSLLTFPELIGFRKTRAMARWADERGFKTAMVERKFNRGFRVHDDEPILALCGVDNESARNCLEEVGFAKVIEAGLGAGADDFLGFRMHVFPGERRAKEIWSPVDSHRVARTDRPAYKNLAVSGLDQCGLTQLAGRTVGAPFVGAIAAALVIGEALRVVNGAHGYDLIDGHLRDLKQLTAIVAADGAPLNPGTTGCAIDEEDQRRIPVLESWSV